MNRTPSIPKKAQDLHSRSTVRTLIDEKLIKAAWLNRERCMVFVKKKKLTEFFLGTKQNLLWKEESDNLE